MAATKETQFNEVGLPRIPLNLRDYKRPIGIQWAAVITSSGILPIIGYFALRYGTDLPLNTILSPWLSFMGVVSVFSLGKRSWDLLKKTSDCRPLGIHQGWKLDYYGWNFLGGFIGLSVLISLGISFESMIIVSLPLSILILYVCIEMLLAYVGVAFNIGAPFRVSSLPRGAPLRPGAYAIAEDVVAVDGQQGQAFRQAWSDRYEASAVIRAHLHRLDLLWGTTGLAIVGVVWGCAFGLNNHEIGYVIGWALPWVWAGIMSVVTIQLSKRMLKREAEMQRSAIAA